MSRSETSLPQEAADPSSGVNENHARGEAGRASQSGPSENHIGLDSSRLNPAGRSDSPTTQWWRVDYWLYAAGGGMTPTWMGLEAVSADDAIAKVQARQNRRDARLGRARCGYFKGATATLLPESRR